MGDTRREQYRLIATTLYDKLLGYFADVMSGCRHLILIPHDILTYLPFAGLLSNARQTTTVSSTLLERHYLIDEYELGYALSMSTLYYSQRKSPGRLGKRALIISNSLPADPLPDLPFAEREADLLEGFFPNSRRLRSPDATVENYRREAPSADVIHLACHAIFDRSSPWLSALCMAPDETGRTRLEAQMIRQIKLKANLVTLSACETALGELAAGGEYVGLIRAFLLAGAKTMIGSLWRVEDEATASLMPMFYEALLKEEGKGIAASLRQAQLTMRQSQRFSDPYYWAALAGYGDMR
jgi:CHAT domain-containing protein